MKDQNCAYCMRQENRHVVKEQLHPRKVVLPQGGDLSGQGRGLAVGGPATAEAWSRLDPTFVSSGERSRDILDFVSDDENYEPMFGEGGGQSELQGVGVPNDIPLPLDVLQQLYGVGPVSQGEGVGLPIPGVVQVVVVVSPAGW